MKLRNLFFVALTAVALIACGSQKKPKVEQQPIDPQLELQDAEQIAPATVEDMIATVEQIIEDGDKSIPGYIVISKESMTLKLYDKNGRIIYNFPVAVGKNYGNKQGKGNMKTPEGVFEIHQIQPASAWGHDFKDGKGMIPHAYGDWFIRLLTPPHTGIGIHGTHAPESIGTRATEGCIRLHNEDLNKLKPLVRIGMKVTIETSFKDMEADGKEAIPAPSTKQDIVPAQEVKKPAETVATTPTTVAENTTPTTTENTTAVVEEQPQVEYTPGEIIEHTIEQGQFISHIAVKYHTTSAKILELNPGVDPAKIRPGQKIKVQPNTDSKPAAKKPVVEEEDTDGTYHTIVSGDMLGKLAITYGTTVEKLKELNPDINPNNLKLGSKIRIK